MKQWFSPRYIEETQGLGYKFIIPARLRWSSLILTAAFIYPFFMFGRVIVSGLFTDFGVYEQKLHFILFSFLWVSVFLWMTFSIVWQLFGREEILILSDRVETKSIVFFDFAKNVYEASSIKNMEISPDAGASVTRKNQYRAALFGYPGIVFDYGSRSVKIAFGLDRAEARQILKKAEKVIPSAFKG